MRTLLEKKNVQCFSLLFRLEMGGRLLLKTTQSVVNFVDGLLSQYPAQLLLVFCAEFIFGKSDVESDVQHSVEIVVFIIGHSFSLLTNPRSRPRHFVSDDVNFVPVQMFNVNLEALCSSRKQQYKKIK